jgi:hypothetical protein
MILPSKKGEISKVKKIKYIGAIYLSKVYYRKSENW